MTVVIAGLLGVATAVFAARLAERTALHGRPHPRRLRFALGAPAVTIAIAVTLRHDLPSAVALLVVLLPAAAAAAVDAHERRLPDPLTAAAALALALEIGVLIVRGSDAGTRGLWAFAAATAICLLAKLTFTDAIGWGDTKLAPSLTSLLAVASWPTLYLGLLAWAALVLLTTVHDFVRRSRTDIVAYGPALVGGTALAAAIAG
jgi:hypothetical protein